MRILKDTENLTVDEVFDRVSIAIYWGRAFKFATRNESTIRAAQLLIKELRKSDFLCDMMEGSDK
jgi:hypothetical protein